MFQIFRVRINSMIKISKATNKETKDWAKTEWDKADIVHYGHPVKWVEKKFRFKAEENGKLIGMVAGKFQSGAVYVGDIIVSDQVRGKGIGTLLMQAVEKYTKKLGGHMMWLVTGKGLPSNAFYKKIGFKMLTEIPHFYFGKDFVIYTKAIK